MLDITRERGLKESIETEQASQEELGAGESWGGREKVQGGVKELERGGGKRE